MYFVEYSAIDKFKVKPYGKISPMVVVVKEGNYYLKKIKPVFTNVLSTKYKKPNSEKETFHVKAGTVTYIGGWVAEEISRRWEYKRDYSDSFLVDILGKEKYLDFYPLNIATDGGEVIEYSWKAALKNDKRKMKVAGKGPIGSPRPIGSDSIEN